VPQRLAAASSAEREDNMDKTPVSRALRLRTR